MVLEEAAHLGEMVIPMEEQVAPFEQRTVVVPMEEQVALLGQAPMVKLLIPFEEQE